MFVCLFVCLMNHEFTVSALDCYNNTLLSLLNEHVPVKSGIETIRPAAPWYSEDIKLEKVKRRKLERKWHRHKLVIHRKMYFEQCFGVNKLIHDTKMRFYTNIFEENTKNQHLLLSPIGRVLNIKADKKLPSHSNDCELETSLLTISVKRHNLYVTIFKPSRSHFLQMLMSITNVLSLVSSIQNLLMSSRHL